MQLRIAPSVWEILRGILRRIRLFQRWFSGSHRPSVHKLQTDMSSFGAAPMWSLPSQLSPVTTASVTGTWTGPFTSGSYTISLNKIGNMVFAHVPQVAQAAATAQVIFQFLTPVPLGFRPAVGTLQNGWTIVNNANPTNQSLFYMLTTGCFAVYSTLGGGQFTNAANCTPVYTDSIASWSVV